MRYKKLLKRKDIENDFYINEFLNDDLKNKV